MNAALEKEDTSSPLDRCTVVVIYDDPFMRARALAACDYLVSQLWDYVELDFSWWRTDFLKEPTMAQAAAHQAVTADFLIVCSTGIDAPSNVLETWFESWIKDRNKAEGALIDLSLAPTDSGNVARLQSLLQTAAQRGRFDYLKTVETQSMERHRSVENLPSPRILPTDGRMGRSRPPSRFGLNE